jgi:CRP/FNR family transcriptional regulator
MLLATLESCELLRGLTSQELASVAEAARVYAFPAQSDIFAEGQPCDGLWILGAGRVRLYHSAPDGRQQVVSFRAPPAVLELVPALDGDRFTATATTFEESTLVFLPRIALVPLARLHPVTAGNVIRQLCLELRQRDISAAVTGMKHARGRITCAILQLARQYGVPVGHVGFRIAYRLTRQDIADRSGVTLETAIRVLSDLQRQGVIRTQSQIIEIVDMQGLRHPTDCDVCQFDCSVFAPSLPPPPR